MKFFMTDPATWSSEIKFLMLLVPSIVVVVGVVIVWLVAATHHFAVLSKAFQNSRGLEDDRQLWGNYTFKGRTMIVAGISIGVVWPKLGISRGWLSEEDFRRAPEYLTRMLKISSWSNTLGSSMLVLNYWLVKF